MRLNKISRNRRFSCFRHVNFYFLRKNIFGNFSQSLLWRFCFRKFRPVASILRPTVCAPVIQAHSPGTGCLSKIKYILRFYRLSLVRTWTAAQDKTSSFHCFWDVESILCFSSVFCSHERYWRSPRNFEIEIWFLSCCSLNQTGGSKTLSFSL